MHDILKSIWALPWYKVLVVSIADDLILAVRLWPILVPAIAVAVCFVLSKRRKRRDTSG